MALATQCPHCGTMFRVAADQLKLRGGIVRCGACHQVFDGNTGLVDLSATPPTPSASSSPAPEPPAVPAATPVVSAPEAPADAQPAASAAPAGEQDADGIPIYTLEFDRTFAPFGILPKATVESIGAPPAAEPGAGSAPEPVAESAPASASEQARELAHEPAHEPAHPPATAQQAAERPEMEAAGGTAVLDLPVDEELVAAPLPDDVPDEPAATPVPAPPPRRIPAPDAPPLLLRESAGGQTPVHAPPSPAKGPRARAAESRARRSKLTPTRIEPPKQRAHENDEPEFVRRGRQREQSGKAVRIALALGSALLLLALAAQAAFLFRDTLAARYPALRPALESTCALLGCRVGLPADIEQIVIETGELATLGGNAYTFSTILRNESALPQAWPSIELTLTSADDKPLVRRVFGPRDYLPLGGKPAAGSPAAGFAARAEQPVKLHFRLEGLEPSGYHIAVFYP